MMRARVLGYGAAVLFHVLALLFGGIFFLKPPDEQQKRDVRDVDLVEAEAEKPDEKQEEAEPSDAASEEPMEVEEERPPDLRQALDLESAAAATPALQALSLGALEGALNPSLGGDDGFGGAASLASGGRIGGTGAALGSAPADDAIFSIAELNRPPRLIVQVAPDYPLEMRRRKVEGTVLVAFLVDQQGKVVNPKVESSTHQAFDGPAIAAVRQWKFEPGVRDQEKVVSRMRVPIRFSAAG
jgi:protein TonB